MSERIERDGAARDAIPRLLAISDEAARAGRPFEVWLERAAVAGVRAVQLREKQLDDFSLFTLARATREHRLGLTVLVNGRADIAWAAGCRGVHLPTDAPPVTAVVRRFGGRLMVGRSTHRVAEVEAAARDGADYVTFGPVFPTPSKARFGAPPGLEGLRAACRVGIPVLALGGVDAERLAEVAEAGAVGAAFIRCGHGLAERAGIALEALVRRADALWPRHG